MTAHQRNAVLPEAFREVARLRHVGDEQVGVAEIIGDVPDRHLDADKASRMDHRPQLCPLGNAEGQGVLGMWTTAMTSGRAAKIAAWMKRSR